MADVLYVLIILVIVNLIVWVVKSDLLCLLFGGFTILVAALSLAYASEVLFSPYIQAFIILVGVVNLLSAGGVRRI